jgi:competence protein ComEC
LICFIATIPIQLVLNYEINIISLFTNFVLSYVVSIIFVLCIIGMPLSSIHGNVFGCIYRFFNKIVSFLSELNTSILFGSIPSWLIIIYYFIFFAALYFIETKKKTRIFFSVSLLFMILISLYFQNYLNPFQRVTFLNVYQGDCTIIMDSYSERVMLIDTGGQLNYDIANKKIIPYLKYHGLDKIDIIVITHDDFDHCGALSSLNENIKIKKIITNNDIKSVSLGKISLENINLFKNENNDKNDNSIVLYGNIGGFNYLFTGDISKRIEKKIIDNFSSLDVDVLKVSHHGSKTSSTQEFLEAVNSSFALIGVGKNNTFGHPNDEVIERLKRLRYKNPQN